MRAKSGRRIIAHHTFRQQMLRAIRVSTVVHALSRPVVHRSSVETLIARKKWSTYSSKPWFSLSASLNGAPLLAARPHAAPWPRGRAAPLASAGGPCRLQCDSPGKSLQITANHCKSLFPLFPLFPVVELAVPLAVAVGPVRPEQAPPQCARAPAQPCGC